jgi:hypothetical protein
LAGAATRHTALARSAAAAELRLSALSEHNRLTATIALIAAVLAFG